MFKKEKVDHSVLCYGWGEENGQKYWLLQNSWGKDWGENGNFK
jgi:cathepsin C